MDVHRRNIFSGAVMEELMGFSRAVMVGKQIYISGIMGIDSETGALADGIAAQTGFALDAIDTVLRDVDSGLDDIVRLRVYLRHHEHFGAAAKVIRKQLNGRYPAGTIIIAELSEPEALVEIEVDAIRHSGGAAAQ